MAIIATSASVGVYYLSGLNNTRDNYRMLQISPGAMCRGGEYMWQGDSKKAEMCRKLDSTPEGKEEISHFQCPNGFDGLPRNPLAFTSNSDSSWTGVRCNGNKVDNTYYSANFPKQWIN